MTMSASEAVSGPLGHPSMSAISPFLKSVRRWYRRRLALKEARAAFMHTIRLDDRILDDMGVTREEVLWAASLPLEDNAALALRARAAKRRTAQAARRPRR